MWKGDCKNVSGKLSCVGGNDRPFLQELFKRVNSGSFGPIDAKNVFVRGWSGGAQMVSWLFQAVAEAAESGSILFNGTQIAGGVILSGGTYQCYASNPSSAIGSCKDCVLTKGRENSCNASLPAMCSWCCPRNYTEEYYMDHSDAWVHHPPVFLGQSSSTDAHADHS